MENTKNKKKIKWSIFCDFQTFPVGKTKLGVYCTRLSLGFFIIKICAHYTAVKIFTPLQQEEAKSA